MGTRTIHQIRVGIIQLPSSGSDSKSGWVEGGRSSDSQITTATPGECMRGHAGGMSTPQREGTGILKRS